MKVIACCSLLVACFAFVLGFWLMFKIPTAMGLPAVLGVVIAHVVLQMNERRLNPDGNYFLAIPLASGAFIAAGMIVSSIVALFV